MCVVNTLTTFVLRCYIYDYWTVLSGSKGEYIVWIMFQHVLLLCGEGSLHKWRRGLPCFVERFRRRGAQAAPVWDAACLAVVVSWHRPAAQDVLQRPEDGTCWAEDDMNTERAFQKRWEATQYFSKIFSFKNHNVIMSSTLMLEKYSSTMLFFFFAHLESLHFSRQW